jgi:hypothetical protein
MKFNLALFGNDVAIALRRDFVLALRHGLDASGHDVEINANLVDPHRVNLLVGAYRIPRESMLRIATSGLRYVVVNTEVVKNGMLNHNPEKVDFPGAYVPLMQRAICTWDVIMDNLPEYRRYGIDARFLRWGFVPELEDVVHAREKTLDYYFFGTMTPRREQMLALLDGAGFKGRFDHAGPNWYRNELIGRAKVQLNVIQKDIYTHVNSFRICYLANNRTAILSEQENDPAGYLDYARVTTRQRFVESFAALVAGDAWRAEAERSYARFAEIPMRDCTDRLLHESFANPKAA